MGDIVKIKFEPRDLWIGLYWDKTKEGAFFYVCLFPCIVIHWMIPR